MMSREAMKLALEALQEVYWSSRSAKHDEAITALREALAEQPVKPYRQLQDNGSKYFGESWDKAEQPAQQEPVKYEFQVPDRTWHPFLDKRHYENTVKDGSWPIRALYTSPQPAQRTWVGLTDKDIEQEFGFIDELLRDCVHRTEAKLRSKNNG